VQEAVTQADVVAVVGALERQVLLAFGQFGERRREAHARSQKIHYAGREHVHSEEAKVVAGAQAWDHQALLGFGGSGLFHDGLDAVEILAAGDALAADRTIAGEQVLTRGLHRRNGARLRFRHIDQLLRAALRGAADIKVVADQMQERILLDEVAGAQHGVAVAQRFRLRNQAQAPGVIARHTRVRRFVSGRNDDANFFDARAQGLFDNDAQHRLFNAIAIDEGLERQAPLVRPGSRDHRFADLHECGSLDIMRQVRSEPQGWLGDEVRMTLNMKLAFIGAGNMGLPIARNLVRSGHSLTIYNRTRERAEPLRQEGAAMANSPADAARDAEAIVTMLADDQAVEQVVQSFAETLARGAIHIGMSTVSVGLSKRLAEMHAARGQIYVAAPVFGRPEAAEAARLWVVTAGAPEHVEHCRPVFDAISRGWSVVGADPWLANVFKLSGNFLIAAAIESLGEAFALVRKSGGDAAQFLDIINNALFNSPLYGGYGGAVVKEKFEPAGFRLRLGFKDLRLVQEAAESAAVPMPLAGVLRDRFLAALARDEGELDWAALARIAAVQAGL